MCLQWHVFYMQRMQRGQVINKLSTMAKFASCKCDLFFLLFQNIFLPIFSCLVKAECLVMKEEIISTFIVVVMEKI